MKIKEGKQETFDEIVKVNSADAYSNRCVTYAVEWAELMEKHLAEGTPLEKCWEGDSRTADTDGITGFMYGAACNILAQCWEHGEALRLLHNAQYNVGPEVKGTVNPAILTFG
jgi:hypothetical protein